LTAQYTRVYSDRDIKLLTTISAKKVYQPLIDKIYKSQPTLFPNVFVNTYLIIIDDKMDSLNVLYKLRHKDLPEPYHDAFICGRLFVWAKQKWVDQADFASDIEWSDE
jgi:hypothetical protein